MTKHDILEYFKDINHYYNNCMMFDSLNSMLNELIETEQSKLGWISVKDRLPEENLEYLVYATDEDGERFVTTDRWAKYGRQWYLFDNGSSTTVTHWMPLPEPPKEET